MKQIFAFLTRLRSALNEVPFHSEGESAQDFMDNVKQGLDAARVSHQNALSEVYERMPFYTQALHEAVTNCLKIAWREIDVIAAAPFGIVSTHTFQIIPEISGLRAEFHNEYDVAAVVIRLRISQLAILPGG